jgi:hypothetical protein
MFNFADRRQKRQEPAMRMPDMMEIVSICQNHNIDHFTSIGAKDMVQRRGRYPFTKGGSLGREKWQYRDQSIASEARDLENGFSLFNGNPIHCNCESLTVLWIALN